MNHRRPHLAGRVQPGGGKQHAQGCRGEYRAKAEPRYRSFDSKIHPEHPWWDFKQADWSHCEGHGLLQ